MAVLAWSLRARGAEVRSVGYRSREADVATLAREVAGEIVHWAAADRVSAVTHSMGGLLLRVAVAEGFLGVGQLGRVVMLGPPNRGSELADRLPEIPIVGPVYERTIGPAGRELGTRPGSLASQLPPVPFEVGVIAGTRSWNPFFSHLLGGPSDGKVRVDRTPVAGMRDFVTVPQWHPFLMLDPRVIRQTISFLATGSFRH
jgi:triacylglycerol lipase